MVSEHEDQRFMNVKRINFTVQSVSLGGTGFNSLQPWIWKHQVPLKCY